MFNFEQILNYFSQNKEVALLLAILTLLGLYIGVKLIRGLFDVTSPARRRCREAGFRYGQRVTVRMTYDNWTDTWWGIVVDAERFCTNDWLIHYRCNGSANDIRTAGTWLVS